MSLRDAIAAAPNAGQPLPWLATAGQPSLADFQAARAAGVRTVIDLRDPMEPRPFDEAAEMAKLGITYVNIPVTPGAPDATAHEKIQAALQPWGCSGGKLEKETEATGLYEIDDAKCKDGQYDIKLDKDFKVIVITRD